MSRISLVINTLNEEEHIADCINSAKSIADEVIVCDMYSDDDTVRIAETLGAKIFFHVKTGFVEPARFFAISNATHEWVLVLDADERLTNALASELKRIAESDEADLVLFGILYNYFGRYIKYGGFFSANYPRFFKKANYFEVYSAEEEMVHNNFANLRIKVRRKIILPHNYYIVHEAYPTFEKYLKKTLCNYSLIESNNRYAKGANVNFIRLLADPVKEFILRYFVKQGFREGKIGLILCYLKSQHTFYTLLNIWFLNRQGSQYNE